MIYVVEILDQKFVKVGFSASESTKQRIAELQTGCPFEIRELFTVDGTIRQEQSLHAAISIAMARCGLPMPPNEWYLGRNPVMQNVIGHLRHGANEGILFAESYNPNVKQNSATRGARTPNIRWPRLSKKELSALGA